MKIYNYLLLGVLGMGFSACSDALDYEMNDTSISVATNENVRFENNVVYVKKGSPVKFLFTDTPDFITFYSGEEGAKYAYRNRTQVDPADIATSTLNFSMKFETGKIENANADIYYSTDFPGLKGNDFPADSTLVVGYAWNKLLPDSVKPMKLNEVKTYALDMKPFFGKKLTVAIHYTSVKDPSAAQPKLTISGWGILNRQNEGATTFLAASSFGFTALNTQVGGMSADQTAAFKNNPGVYPYATVENNTSGIWNLKDINNSFFIHSSGKNAVGKDAWLVSAPMEINAATPDKGISLKNVAQRVDDYTHTYTNVGKYTATFVLVNANYKHNQQLVKTLTVEVHE